MQDRFKFRVWCKECKEWEKDQVAITNKENYIINFSNQNFTRVTNIDPVQHEINFCTGLKDKNSKLIYEGDILKDKYGALHPISWNVKCFYEADTFAVAGFYNTIQEDMEVIGNIYENPELLELKNE